MEMTEINQESSAETVGNVTVQKFENSGDEFSPSLTDFEINDQESLDKTVGNGTIHKFENSRDVFSPSRYEISTSLDTFGSKKWKNQAATATSSEVPEKSAAKPMQTPPHYSSSTPYSGLGAPSSMYMGVPPHGSSLFNGSSVPPYDVPYSGESAYHCDSSSHLGEGSSYRPLHLSAPSAYSSASIIGNGGLYHVAPRMDCYGMGMPMSHAAMGPRPGFFPEDQPAKRRGSEGTPDKDWACPNCGNVNISFRTVCNRRKCNTPKPGSQKSAAKPMQTPPHYSSSTPYSGPGAPSSMYMGVPPHGSSLFNGSSVPPYDVPYSGGSAYHCDSSSHLGEGSPYRPLHLSAPSAYSSASIIGNGGLYHVAPRMDRYGLGMPMSHTAMGPRPGFFLEDQPGKRRGSERTRDNNWACPNCGNVNFSFRTVCNMRKCKTPKPGSQVTATLPVRTRDPVVSDRSNWPETDEEWRFLPVPERLRRIGRGEYVRDRWSKKYK